MNYNDLTKKQIISIHKDALEYIEEQEKEIERLKEEYIILQNASDEVEEELQQRINKAIEYIEKHEEKQYGFNYEYELNIYEIEDLKNILKGVDKE